MDCKQDTKRGLEEMTKKCTCGHTKGQHENTRDYGRNSGACKIFGCKCSTELFGYSEAKA